MKESRSTKRCWFGSPWYRQPLLYLVTASIFVVSVWDNERQLLARSLLDPVAPSALARTPLPDKAKHSVALESIHFVTPGGMVDLANIPDDRLIALRNQIPPIHRPQFAPAQEVTDLADDELVIGYSDGDDAWAFPVRILNHRELVNANLGGQPLLVSYCPLCGSGVVYSRRFEGTVLDFGNSHGLRESDMVMFDYQSGSLWQQLSGVALVGTHSGKTLKALPSMTTTWHGWKDLHPETLALTNSLSSMARFDSARYRAALDDGRFHVSGVSDAARDDRLPAGARVLVLTVDGRTCAFPLPERFQQRVSTRSIAGRPILLVVHGRGGMAFDPVVDGRLLTFQLDGGVMRDRETGSVWRLTGVAESGPLTGRQLRKFPVRTSYWFAIAAMEKDVVVKRL